MIERSDSIPAGCYFRGNALVCRVTFEDTLAQIGRFKSAYNILVPFISRL